MSIDFGGESHNVPRGVVIGIIGDTDSGVHELLYAAGGRLLKPGGELDFSPTPLVSIDYALDLEDAFTRQAAESQFHWMRRSGCTVIIASHDPGLLSRTADELWWVSQGRVQQKGDATEILALYARHTSERLRAAGSGRIAEIHPSMRRGDGRARLLMLQTRNAEGTPVATFRSGEPAVVFVEVVFQQSVEDPVVGIMIRTRVGMEVYGTNTELEQLKLSPCSAGETRAVSFRFDCDLCPQTYTITAASHDPDGVWHDWLEDAVAFTVTDDRYTAGVANLRAQVSLSEPQE